MGEVSKESSLQRPSSALRGAGELGAWPDPTGLSSQGAMGVGGGRLQLMSGKMFQWQRLFKRKPEWGDRGFRSRWEARLGNFMNT